MGGPRQRGPGRSLKDLKRELNVKSRHERVHVKISPDSATSSGFEPWTPSTQAALKLLLSVSLYSTHVHRITGFLPGEAELRRVVRDLRLRRDVQLLGARPPAALRPGDADLGVRSAVCSPLLFLHHPSPGAWLGLRRICSTQPNASLLLPEIPFGSCLCIL